MKINPLATGRETLVNPIKNWAERFERSERADPGTAGILSAVGASIICCVGPLVLLAFGVSN
jgi:hypothetical protein